jgi:hypothetical protein
VLPDIILGADGASLQGAVKESKVVGIPVLLLNEKSHAKVTEFSVEFLN